MYLSYYGIIRNARRQRSSLNGSYWVPAFVCNVTNYTHKEIHPRNMTERVDSSKYILLSINSSHSYSCSVDFKYFWKTNEINLIFK